MRILRKQLIELLDQARLQNRLDELAPRLLAALVHDFFSLLPAAWNKHRHKNIALTSRTVSHANLHRHIIAVRCPDQAFYLDAIKGYLLRRGIQPLAQQTMVARMDCDDSGCTLSLRKPDKHDEDNFMFIALHISATLEPDRDRLSRDIRAIMQAVDLSVTDFAPMREIITSCAGKLVGEDSDAAALLEWMNDDKYLYFGMQTEAKKLGLVRNQQVLSHIARGLKEEIAALERPKKTGVEWLQLAASQHYLYSAASLEVMRISWRNSKRNRLQSTIVIGHFSRSARHANASRIPLLERYWQVLADTPLLQQSAFYRREIRTLFDRLPKPALLAIPPKRWLEPLKAIVDLAGPVQTMTRQLIPSSGNISILLVALPANRFGPNILGQILEAARTAHHFTVQSHEGFGVGPHRLLLISANNTLANGEPIKETHITALGKTIQQCVTFWKDRAKVGVLDAARNLNLPDTLKELEQISPLYQQLFPPHQFIEDIRIRDKVIASGRTLVRAHAHDAGIELHIFTQAPLLLGELVTIVQAFGLTAIQEAVVDFGPHDRQVHLSSIRCQTAQAFRADDEKRLMEGMERVLNDEADNDPVNALLLAAGLNIDQVAIIITLRNHLIQLLADAAPTPLTDMLRRHPLVAAKLYRLFEARHRPAMPVSFEAQSRLEFDKAMTGVQNLTDDRWFRALAEIVDASLRSNSFMREAGEPVAIKIDPSRLSFAPRPAPYREMFVHGVHVEGVHLRAGPVARGGIRYSDRPADFRTEVLELMATQVVKNGQIVPTGAKGGFVVRNGDGEPFVRQQYRTFIRALLGLTDNLVHNEASPPTGIRIHEGDSHDPYLVVAADKGTARYSDVANEESRLAGFWLDDAFASGGKHGYDHKEVGITARGAWICAAHHFTLLGRNAYTDPVSVVGIGDMSGDVFGNGMLLNPNIRLVGAFNHRHIFLDPDPDPERSYAERRRLFEEAAGWEQYDPAYISQSGGIFKRQAKSIPISAEAQQVLGITETSLSGEALIKALLTADVDLLYNGGIGTYVKASTETHADVRDPANNAVRVDADQLRATVICEGGNLGLTQQARLQYAASGGHINTDAIDNSAGVDMSDHEVNLKILFASRADDITPAKRNRILKDLTEKITAQCLDNNLLQSQALTLASLDAVVHPPRIQRLRDELLRTERIDPHTDPDICNDESLVLRPQLAVLFGHEKNRIHDRLSEEGFDQHTCFRSQLLLSYFPASIQRRFTEDITGHPLSRDIINTRAVNDIVNHMGLGAVHHLETLLDNPLSDIVQALLLTDVIMDSDTLREAIWQHTSDPEIASQMQRSLQEHLMHFAEELLRLCTVEPLNQQWVLQQRTGMRRFRHSLAAQGIGGMESSRYLDLLKTVAQAGLSSEHAAHLATMPELAQTAAAVHLSADMNIPLLRCLKASQACLHLLPISEVEAPLRSSGWGEEETHELRREWLHRLTLLKSRAIEDLLRSGSTNFIRTGEKLWCSHKHWPDIEPLRKPQLDAVEEEGEASMEISQMQLLLALTRLESIIDESDARSKAD
ncbi:MAG: NAD-glutamate dehydrogenase domain-containing protein [Mariprofundaceae bacterium]